MKEEALSFFCDKFSESAGDVGLSLLEHIPSLVIDDFNNSIKAFPILKEVKKVVIELNRESDSIQGFTVIFFHSYWNFVGEDIFRVVNAFYEYLPLPNSSFILLRYSYLKKILRNFFLI